jgi:zinc protease
VSVQLDRLGIDYLDRRPALINAVTKADVARVAKRLLDADKLTGSWSATRRLQSSP